ncbi:hypothetical protein [Bacteroides acidifaciens]|uniref:hypothetical protein n=1 Tax=Bacteroides acidifaciens TaxID=85831 RepID=UPI0025A60F29|nr:hypothetical protein [Bacteroides acidifaciens]
MGYVAPETEINAPSGLIPSGVYTDDSGYYGGFGGSGNMDGNIVYNGGEGGGSNTGSSSGGVCTLITQTDCVAYTIAYALGRMDIFDLMRIIRCFRY